MNIPLLQTKNWQKLQSDLGETTFFEQNQDVQYLAIKKSTPVGDYLYLPYGPHFFEKPSAKTVKNAFKGLLELAKRENAIFIRVEPQNASALRYLRENGIKSHDLNPIDTWILDLTPEKSQIIANFSQGTRTCFNNYAKKGLSVEITKNPEQIKNLINFQAKLAEIKKINVFSEDYLKTELAQDFASLFLAKYLAPGEKTAKIIAASLFFDYDGTRFYMQSAADPNYRKLPATVALLTTAIFDAKEKGFKNFDFWGIAPENAPKNHPWAGFTAFKKSFGGEAVHYCGTWDIPVNRGKYRFYQIFRTLNRVIRKIK